MDAKGDTHYRGNAVLVVPFLNFSAGPFSLFFLMRRKRGGVTVSRCFGVGGDKNICVGLRWNLL